MHKFKLEDDFDDLDPKYYSKRDIELMYANNFKDYYIIIFFIKTNNRFYGKLRTYN